MGICGIPEIAQARRMATFRVASRSKYTGGRRDSMYLIPRDARCGGLLIQYLALFRCARAHPRFWRQADMISPYSALAPSLSLSWRFPFPPIWALIKRRTPNPRRQRPACHIREDSRDVTTRPRYAGGAIRDSDYTLPPRRLALSCDRYGAWGRRNSAS